MRKHPGVVGQFVLNLTQETYRAVILAVALQQLDAGGGASARLKRTLNAPQ